MQTPEPTEPVSPADCCRPSRVMATVLLLLAALLASVGVVVGLAELLSYVRFRVLLLAGLLVSLAVTGVLAFLALRRRESQHHDQQLHDARLRHADADRQLSATFDLASIGLAQADPFTGRWLRVNQKMCAITGYTAEELVQLRVPDITHPSDRDAD
jgi:PAS domain-containing protein